MFCGMPTSIDSAKILLVGHIANYNWILGNWMREIKARSSGNLKIWWLPTSYNNIPRSTLFTLPLPKSDVYFFSYPTIFRNYLAKHNNRYSHKSIVNYTHEIPELGTKKQQADYLNSAYSIHFNCSRDASELVENGLDSSKVRIVYGAIDDDCSVINQTRRNSSVLLASRFSERKGVRVLPELINSLPNWKFHILGRGWEDFLIKHKLDKNLNVVYEKFTRESRNRVMNEVEVFLSLSTLEGGPIPLLESIKLGMKPVATMTGFAPDIIEDGVNGILIPINSEVPVIREAILRAQALTQLGFLDEQDFSWDRISKIFMQDVQGILCS